MVAREHRKLKVGCTDFLKHAERRRNMDLRECRILEHFQNNVLRARHIQVLEALRGSLDKKPRLRLQRLCGLIFGLMLLPYGDERGGRRNDREDCYRCNESGGHAMAAEEFTQLNRGACRA